MSLEEQMFSLVEEFLKSGKTQREFSLKAGIGRAKFNYWVCKYRNQHQEQPSAAFLRVDTTSDKQGQQLEILYPNGVRLKVGGADLSLISQLIRFY